MTKRLTLAAGAGVLAVLASFAAAPAATAGTTWEGEGPAASERVAPGDGERHALARFGTTWE